MTHFNDLGYISAVGSAVFVPIPIGRLHYMPGFSTSQAVFASKNLLLTADLQGFMLLNSFIEETVKSGIFLNTTLPAGGIFSGIAAGILFKNTSKRLHCVFFAQKSPCQTV